MPEHGALLKGTVGEALKAAEDTVKTTKANKPATKPSKTPATAPADASDEPMEEIEDLGTITLTDSEPEDGIETLEG